MLDGGDVTEEKPRKAQRHKKMPRSTEMRPRMIAFLVSFRCPEGASARECRAYVEEAIKTQRGSLRPPGSHDEADDGDPMWSLDEASVKIRKFHAKRRRMCGEVGR